MTKFKGYSEKAQKWVNLEFKSIKQAYFFNATLKYITEVK